MAKFSYGGKRYQIPDSIKIGDIIFLPDSTFVKVILFSEEGTGKKTLVVSQISVYSDVLKKVANAVGATEVIED